MIQKQSAFLLLLSFLFILSCKKNETEEEEPPIDYAIQVVDDDALLTAFLESHTYNYEDFENPTSERIQIVIDTLSGDNANKTPLIDLVETTQVPVTDSDGDITQHTLYHLIARQGVRVEDKPSVVDSVYLSYEGKLLNGTVFDSRTSPVWFDNTQVVSGFRNGVSKFAPGTFSVADDGVVSFEDYGQGLIFMPSGLGYYNRQQGVITPYSPLIFEVLIYTIARADHDGDGILSKDEDVDLDGNPLNDDTDEDQIANCFDSDDDGDGIPTRFEYDEDEDGVPDDTDEDGIPDYLDNDNN